VNPFVDDDVPQGAQVFVMLGVLLGAIFGGALVLFVGGEILSDPGGVQGALMVVAWLALPLLLSIVALVRPPLAYRILVVVVALVLLASIAAIPLAEPIWEFEDTHGPINLLVIIGALIPFVVVLIAGFVILQSVSLLLIGQWSVVLVFVVLMAPFVAVAVLFVIGGMKSKQPVT